MIILYFSKVQDSGVFSQSGIGLDLNTPFTSVALTLQTGLKFKVEKQLKKVTFFFALGNICFNTLFSSVHQLKNNQAA